MYYMDFFAPSRSGTEPADQEAFARGRLLHGSYLIPEPLGSDEAPIRWLHKPEGGIAIMPISQKTDVTGMPQ